MLDIQGSICQRQVINELIKPNTRGQFDFVGISITVYHILSGMGTISKKDSFGDMVRQLGFYLFRGLYIDTTSKGMKGGEFLFLGCFFINRQYGTIIGKRCTVFEYIEKTIVTIDA